MSKEKINKELLLNLGFKEYDKNMFSLEIEDEEITLYDHPSVNGSKKGHVVNHEFDNRVNYMFEVEMLIDNLKCR